MAVAGHVAFFFWSKAARRVMLLLYFVSFVVGGMGFYFHNHGSVKKVITASVNAWVDSKMDHSDEPPMVAPLAFAGLAVIGILASLERFNFEEPAMPKTETVRSPFRSSVASMRPRRIDVQSHNDHGEAVGTLLLLPHKRARGVSDCGSGPSVHKAPGWARWRLKSHTRLAGRVQLLIVIPTCPMDGFGSSFRVLRLHWRHA